MRIFRACPDFARVLVDDSAGNAFDYELPEAVAAQAPARLARAGAGADADGAGHDHRAAATRPTCRGVKPITEVVSAEPILSPLLLRLGAWIADYYCCSLEAAMKSVLPQVIRKAEVGHKTQLFARLARDVAAEELEALEKKAPLQAAAVDFLAAADKPVAVAELAEECDATHQVVQALVKKGFVADRGRESRARPHRERDLRRRRQAGDEPGADSPSSSGCSAAIDQSRRQPPAIDGDSIAASPILLHGVTGSGKTEIYLQAIQLVLERGQTRDHARAGNFAHAADRRALQVALRRDAARSRRAALAPQRRRAARRMAQDPRAAARGSSSARAPPSSRRARTSGSSSSMKSTRTPTSRRKRRATTGATSRCCARSMEKLRRACSAAPRLRWRATTMRSSANTSCCALTMRVDDKKMPFIRIIDMRMESQKNGAILSRAADHRDQRAAREEGADDPLPQSPRLLHLAASARSAATSANARTAPSRSPFTARRAASSATSAATRRSRRASARSATIPAIKYSGTGTEKVEDAVGEALSQGRGASAWTPTRCTRRDAYRETLGAFRTGKIDILVGTQMIAKGPALSRTSRWSASSTPTSACICPISAPASAPSSSSPRSPDAPAAAMWRAKFSCKVSRRFSPSIQFARHHDFDGFWEQEIEFRRQWDYPPFTHLVLIVSPLRRTRSAREFLRRDAAPPARRKRCPPAPRSASPRPRRWRNRTATTAFTSCCAAARSSRLSRHLRAVLEKLTFPEDVIVTVDVDAYQLL